MKSSLISQSGIKELGLLKDKCGGRDSVVSAPELPSRKEKKKASEGRCGDIKCIPVILVSRRLNAGVGKYENILIHFRIRDVFMSI